MMYTLTSDAEEKRTQEHWFVF